MVIDTHVHFLDPQRLEYPWLGGAKPLQRAFTPGDFQKAYGSVPIEQVVFVEVNCLARQCEEEVFWIEELAQEGSLPIGAIVAYADLTDPNESARSALLERQLARPLVRCIRHNIQGHPPGFCLQSSFVAGVREVHRRGGHFELCVTHDQLDDVIELVRRCPEGRFMLNHGGKPAIRQNLQEPWKAKMAELARFDHLACKISGLFTEADLSRQSVEEVYPYARHILDCFGFDRVFYGSDWPVCTLAAEGKKWFEFTEKLTAACSPTEKKKFYRDNAIEFYRLGKDAR